MPANTETLDRSITIDDEARVIRKLTWRIVPLLGICWVVNWIDRINIGFARMGFQHDLDVSEIQIGIIIGIYSFGYLLCEVPSNMLMEKIGARKTITRIMLAWGIVMMVSAFARNGNDLVIARLVLGAAEAGFFPGALLYMTYWFPAAYRARITSRFIIGNAVAGIIGAPLSGWIMSSMAGVGALQGWQWLFILEGLPAVILACVVWFYLSDRPGEGKWLSPAELVILRRILDRDPKPIDGSSHAKDRLLAVLKDQRVYLLAIGFCFTIMCTGNVVQIWAPAIIKEAGASDVYRIGWLSALPWAIGVVFMLIVAKSSDSKQERRWHFFVMGLTAGVAMLLVPVLSSTVTGAVAALSLLTSAYLASISVFWTISALYLSPGSRASGIAFINTLGQLGGLFTPNLIVWARVHSGDLRLGLSIIGVIVLCGVLSVFAATIKKTSPVARVR